MVSPYRQKQVILVRKDLKMRRGKEIAQSCHASLAAILNLGTFEHSYINGATELNIPVAPQFQDWLEDKFAKICVTVQSEEELLHYYSLAKAAKIPCSLILDEGLTEFGGIKTYTCAAIGPWTSDVIDPITKDLKLY